MGRLSQSKILIKSDVQVYIFTYSLIFMRKYMYIYTISKEGSKYLLFKLLIGFTG